MKKAKKEHRALKASEKIEFVKINDKLLPAEYFQAMPDPGCKCTVSHFFIRHNMEAPVKRAIENYNTLKYPINSPDGKRMTAAATKGMQQDY